MLPLASRHALCNQKLPIQQRKGCRERGWRKNSPPYAKMHVPSDSFGGRSPERKAAEALSTFFTFAAVKIILAQLEGSGRGGLASYNAKGYKDLMAFLEAHPMKNGDEWLAKLMAENELLGVRVMEVREAYCGEDFEWDQCQQLTTKLVKESNARIMRQHAVERFGSSFSMTPPGDEGPER